MKEFLIALSKKVVAYEGVHLPYVIEIAFEESNKSTPALNNRFIYHYNAQYQTMPGRFNCIDGIAKLESPIKTMDDYQRLKQIIDPENHEILQITNLSFIGMEGD